MAKVSLGIRSRIKFNDKVAATRVFRYKAYLANRSGMEINQHVSNLAFIDEESFQKRTNMNFNNQVPTVCVYRQSMSWTQKWNEL